VSLSVGRSVVVAASPCFATFCSDGCERCLAIAALVRDTVCFGMRPRVSSDGRAVLLHSLAGWLHCAVVVAAVARSFFLRTRLSASSFCSRFIRFKMTSNS